MFILTIPTKRIWTKKIVKKIWQSLDLLTALTNEIFKNIKGYVVNANDLNSHLDFGNLDNCEPRKH